jgi:hypothetical protein
MGLARGAFGGERDQTRIKAVQCLVIQAGEFADMGYGFL